MKKVLATILALVMALSVATTAWAEMTENCTAENCGHKAAIGTTHYDTLAAAITAASSGATVKLIANTDENVTVSGKELTLDLNGCTLNGKQVKGTPALTVESKVTVIDSSNAKTGTIMREDTAENSGVSSHYVIDVQGTNGHLIFESGNVVNGSGIVGVKGASLVRIGNDSNTSAKPVMDINGGTFKQDNFIAIKVDCGTLNVNGGTITSANSYAVENWLTANINGGTINGTAASWAYSGGDNSTLTISGGTINGNVNAVNYGSTTAEKATVSVTGGTVSGTLDTRSYDPQANTLASIKDNTKADIGVSGGVFSANVSEYAGTTAVASLNGTYYVGTTDIDKAVESMGAGDTLTVVNGTVKIGNSEYTAGSNATYTVPPRYYYNSTTTTTGTKADGTKGSPKTFDAGVGIYAVSALLSVTGMAYVGKKKF